MIKFTMNKRQLLDMKVYQVAASYDDDRYFIAIGLPKTTGVEAFLSVSDKLLQYAEQLKATAKELKEKSADIGLSAEKQPDGSYFFYMDEKLANSENK